MSPLSVRINVEAAVVEGREVSADGKRSCLGRLAPDDVAIAADWTCPDCGHGFEPHEVGYDGRFILDGCRKCERNAEKTVLEAKIEREPLTLKRIDGSVTT